MEIPDDFRARLLEIAGRRGQKGFSGLITEALELYLDREQRNEAALSEAMALMGSISPAEALDLRGETEAIRAHWR